MGDGKGITRGTLEKLQAREDEEAVVRNMQVNVARLLERYSVKKAAEAVVAAKKRFDESEDAEDCPQAMTATTCKQMLAMKTALERFDESEDAEDRPQAMTADGQADDACNDDG